jgi:hypothetical protein
MRPLLRAALAPLLAAATACATAPTPVATTAPDSGFGPLIERLSEPGGYFPSDNLVSNETSYLHVLGRMRRLGVSGGAYIGVGPDQNFSYIAQVRPEIAFLIDIRRDNLLHHLLFKALFEQARTRVEYLALLLGRPLPASLDEWRDATVQQLVDYMDRTPASADAFAAASARVRAAVQSWGVPLAEADLITIAQIHDTFRARGLDIQYSFGGRYPTYRDLLLETDLDRVQRNYLASEDDFLFLKELERRNRVVPVVGDLGGAKALAAIGREIAARGLRVSAFYLSNVEQYLMRGATFPQFSANVAGLPFDERSVLIRSYFGRGGSHPHNIPGHNSTQLLERFETFVAEHNAGGYRSYQDLVIKNVLPLWN